MRLLLLRNTSSTSIRAIRPSRVIRTEDPTRATRPLVGDAETGRSRSIHPGASSSQGTTTTRPITRANDDRDMPQLQVGDGREMRYPGGLAQPVPTHRARPDTSGARMAEGPDREVEPFGKTGVGAVTA